MNAAQSAPLAYKCQRCGRQSPIEAAFVIQKRKDGSLKRCFCFECENRRASNSTLLLYIVLPLCGALILRISPGSSIGYLFLLVFAGLLVSIPLIVLHELAHAVVAQALGFRVFGIHLGLGKVLFSRRIAGIAWTIHMIPSSGATLVAGPEMNNYKTRIFLIHLAGSLFHALLNAILLWVNRVFDVTGLWYQITLWTNVFLLLTNLFPHKAQVAVGSTGTDGWAMLNAPRLTSKDLQARYASYYILETVRAVESGDMEAARAFAEKGVAFYADDANMRNTLGYVYVNSGEYLKSRQVFLETLAAVEELPSATKAILMNNIAFANLMLEDLSLLPEADDFSSQAYEMLSWEPSITGTRGSVLVALGQHQQGIALLEAALHKQPDKRNKALDACLLAWAEWKRGDAGKAESYLALARQLDSGCILHNYVQDKIHRKAPLENLEMVHPATG